MPLRFRCWCATSLRLLSAKRLLVSLIFLAMAHSATCCVELAEVPYLQYRVGFSFLVLVPGWRVRYSSDSSVRVFSRRLRFAGGPGAHRLEDDSVSPRDLSPSVSPTYRADFRMVLLLCVVVQRGLRVVCSCKCGLGMGQAGRVGGIAR